MQANLCEYACRGCGRSHIGCLAGGDVWPWYRAACMFCGKKGPRRRTWDLAFAAWEVEQRLGGRHDRVAEKRSR